MEMRNHLSNITLDHHCQNLCDKEDLIGKWSTFFGNMPEEKLYFNVLDEILPHSEEYYLGCNEDALELPPYVQPSIGE